MSRGANVLLVADEGVRLTPSMAGARMFRACDTLTRTLAVLDPAARIAAKPFAEGLLASELRNPEIGAIFLFGFRGVIQPSHEDRQAFREFVQDGGGAFATGDHGTRGGHLCGELFGVSELRRWRALDGARPNPGQTAANLKDTLHDANSREVYGPPKPIFATHSDPEVHPLIRRTRGRAIRFLPNHRHEGHLADDPLSPELEACGRLQDVAMAVARNRAMDELQLVTVVRSFEPDDPAKMGRMVVDSTIHHWFDGGLEFLAPEWLADADAYMANVLGFVFPEARRREAVIRLLQQYAADDSRLAAILPAPAELPLLSEIGLRSIGVAAHSAMAADEFCQRFILGNLELLRQSPAAVDPIAQLAPFHDRLDGPVSSALDPISRLH